MKTEQNMNFWLDRMLEDLTEESENGSCAESALSSEDNASEENVGPDIASGRDIAIEWVVRPRLGHLFPSDVDDTVVRDLREALKTEPIPIEVLAAVQDLLRKMFASIQAETGVQLPDPAVNTSGDGEGTVAEGEGDASSAVGTEKSEEGGNGENEPYFLPEKDPSEIPEVVKPEKKKWPLIPKKRLNEIIRAFPLPIVEHCRRCRQIATFFVEYLSTEEWFCASEIRAKHLSGAVYYHDVGKSALTLDDYYLDSKPTNVQTGRYMRHVEEGLSLLQRETDVLLGDYPDGTYEAAIRDAVADHHERYDGKGKPFGKAGDSISLAGRLCALTDEIDYKFFVSGADKESYGPILDGILASAGSRFDPKLTAILADHREVFLSFLNDIRAYYAKKRNTDAYGMRFRFSPMLGASDGDAVALRAHLYLNDPYYGVVDSDLLVPLMEDHPRLHTFKRLELRRLCRLFGEANENGTANPTVMLCISPKALDRPKNFNDAFRFFSNFGIRYHQFLFTVTEADAIAYDADIAEATERFHEIGALFGISEFGGDVTLLPSLDRIRPDVVILQKKYASFSGKAQTTDMLRHIVTAASRSGIGVWCDGVKNERERILLSHEGVFAVSGEISGEEFSEAEFVNGRSADRQESR